MIAAIRPAVEQAHRDARHGRTVGDARGLGGQVAGPPLLEERGVRRELREVRRRRRVRVPLDVVLADAQRDADRGDDRGDAH